MEKQRTKIRQLAKRSRWKRITFTVVINFLLFWQTAIDYYYYLNFNFLFARRAFVKRTQQRAQQRVHWVGAQVAKPPRDTFGIGVPVRGIPSSFATASACGYPHPAPSPSDATRLADRPPSTAPAPALIDSRDSIDFYLPSLPWVG